MRSTKTLKQNVKFTYLDFEIEASVEWIDNDPDYTINFFNPHTGYTNSSSPHSIMNGWSYQNAIDNYELNNLIEAINNFYQQNGSEWTEHLSWEDEAEDTIQFEWDNESYSSEIAYIDNDTEVYYKQLDYTG